MRGSNLRYLATAFFLIICGNSAQACQTSAVTVELADRTFNAALEAIGAARSSEDWSKIRLQLECLSENRYAPASELLASLLLGSELGAPDLVSVHKYLQIAFEDGNAERRRDIANSYLFGKFDGRELGVDVNTAIEYFVQASRLGDSDASASLCSIFRSDLYKVQDYRSAIDYCTIAADQGDPLSEITAAELLYEHGDYPSDSEEATKLYFRSALRGSNTGPMGLGRAYEEGVGVLQDFMLAHAWYNIASSRLGPGNQEEAAEARDRVARNLSSDQIIDAQTLAKQILADMASFAP